MNLPTAQDMRDAYRPHKLKFISQTSFALGWNMCRAWFKKHGEEEKDYCRQIKTKLKTPLG